MCGPNENEISKTIINAIEKKNCVSLSQKKIGELIPIISQCDLYVGNDSFGHHITSQCGIPSIVIMLDTPRAYTIIVLINIESCLQKLMLMPSHMILEFHLI